MLAQGATNGDPKRRRRSSSSTIATDDPLMQQMAELEDENSAIDADMAEIAKQVADLQWLLKEKQRRRNSNGAKLARLQTQVAKAKCQHRRGTTDNNPRVEEALCIYKSGSLAMDELLNQKFPDLIDNVDFWWAFVGLVDPKPDEKVVETMQDKQPRSVLNNKELLLQLCKYNPQIYRAIPQNWKLKGDAQILEIVLDLAPYLVKKVPHGLQLQNPNLVGRALAGLPLRHFNLSRGHKSRIEPIAWNNRAITLGWVKGGGELHDQIPQSLREDEEILLTSIGNKAPTNFPDYIPIRFRSRKGFMMKAIEQDPGLLAAVAVDLKGDEDLGIAALSSPYGACVYRLSLPQFIPDGNGSSRRRFWYQVCIRVDQELCAHEAFVKLVLGSIHFSETKQTAFGVLDQGKETSLAIKKLIAEYAGVPTGKELKKLHRARKNLAQAGIRGSVYCPSTTQLESLHFE